MLARRGIDASTAEDAVQETAVRVLRTGVAYADGEELFRWASVVAWRLAIDAKRKDGRAQPGPVPDRQSGANVALAVEHRTALEAVGRGLRAMSAIDRRAVLDQLSGTVPTLTRQQSARLAVRRHRARSRLLLLTQGLLGVLGWLASRRRQITVPRTGLVAAIGAPVVLVAVVLLPSVGPAPVVGVRMPGPAPVTSPAASTTTVAPNVPPPVAEPASPAPESPQLTPARPATPDPPAAAGVLPPIEVAVPDPLGGTTVVGGRPREPDDHTLCVELPGIPLPCLDVPLPLPPLL